MPRKSKCSCKTRRRRGAGIRDWIRKGHSYLRKHNVYSKGLSRAYSKWGKPYVNKKLGKHAHLVNQGVAIALDKLKQRGYGLRRAGMGLKRAGMGRRLKY